MNFKTRTDRASAVAAGQAQPLPVPREDEGRAAPLPTPRAGDGRATPLPVAPRVDDVPDDDDPPPPAAHETYSITKPALDYYYDRAKGHFARFNNMSVAFKLAGRDLKTRIVKTGRVFDLKPATAIESFLRSHALRTRDGAPQEAPDVAARRRDWDEAKRTGEPGAMTTTANALMRAVEEARGHLGAHEAAHAAGGDGARHATSEILNPIERATRANELAPDIHEGVPTHGSVAKWIDAEGARRYLAPEGDIVPSEGRQPKSDDDMPPGKIAHGDGVLDEHLATLTAKHAKAVATAIMNAPPGKRSEILEQLRARAGDAIAAQVIEKLPYVSASVDGGREAEDGEPRSGAESNEEAVGGAALQLAGNPPTADGEFITATTRQESQGDSVPLSYRDRYRPDYDTSGGDIGQDFDDAIDRHFNFVRVGADRVAPFMGRIALERTLGRPLRPVEVEAYEAMRVFGRRLTRVERVELLSRNVIRGRIAEEATAKFFKALGYKVWAQNVTIVTRAGIRRIDVVVRDKFGRFWAIESKAGGAARNAYQRRVDLEIERNGGVFVGERAGPLEGVRHRMGTIEMQIPGI